MPVELDEISEGQKGGPCVRLTTLEGEPEQVERAVELVREHVLPTVRSRPGCRGVLGLLSLDGRRALALSFWESESALRDSGGGFADLRTRANLVGLSVTEVDQLRVVFDEK